MTEQEIINRYLASATPMREIGIIADELNMLAPEIIRILCENHLFPPRKERTMPFRWTPENDTKLAELTEAGTSAKEIAAYFGVNKQAIYDRRKILKNLKKEKSMKIWTSQEDTELQTMANNGRDIREIAEHFGVKIIDVTERLKRLEAESNATETVAKTPESVTETPEIITETPEIVAPPTKKPYVMPAVREIVDPLTARLITALGILGDDVMITAIHADLEALEIAAERGGEIIELRIT